MFVFFFIHEVLNFRKFIIHVGQKSNIFLTDFLAGKKTYYEIKVPNKNCKGI